MGGYRAAGNVFALLRPIVSCDLKCSPMAALKDEAAAQIVHDKWVLPPSDVEHVAQLPFGIFRIEGYEAERVGDTRLSVMRVLGQMEFE